MATFEYKPGLGNVGSYQASGKPWVESQLVVPAEDGAALKVHFPTVTKEVTIRNDSTGSIRVGFSAKGVSGSSAPHNYFTLAENGSFTAPVKVTDVFLISDTAVAYEATVVAALTGIDSEFLVNNWSGSAGVG